MVNYLLKLLFLFLLIYYFIYQRYLKSFENFLKQIGKVLIIFNSFIFINNFNCNKYIINKICIKFYLLNIRGNKLLIIYYSI